MIIFRYLRKLANRSDHPVVQQLENYAYLIRLDRPVGIWLLLWPTLWALWIAAEGIPHIGVLIVFTLGVVFMRSAGCAINDYADRKVDGKVARTKGRPIVSGKVSPKEAVWVFVILTVSAFLLVLFMNPLTIYLSLGGAALAISYPFMKRYHFLPQVHLGAAFGWSVPMAYAAQSNEIPPIAWLLFIATVLWATAYDTMYAMADREDDIKIGMKSTAILFGEADWIIIGIIQIMLIVTLLMIGSRAELGMFYYLGIFIASLFAVYQQYLITERDPKMCIEAFLNNNWFGMSVFIGIALDYFYQ